MTRAGSDDGRAPGLTRFLTLADTAELLNVSVRHAHDLVRSGELRAIRVGERGPWRVERTALEDFIEARYEANRRRALWEQARYADLPELFV